MTETATAATELCTSCGLCCTGALHDNAALDDDELGSARRLGLPVNSTQPAAFALPCPKLDGSRCSIYAERPRVCGRYECALLLRVKEGSEGLNSALDKVATAKNLVSELRAAIPPGTDIPAARQAAIAQASSGGAPLEASRAHAILRSMALTLYLDTHFRNQKEGPYFSMGNPISSERMDNG